MDLSAKDIRWIFTYVFVLVVSVALHEFGHAMMGDRLGDPTPRRQGRVTLNPLAHADPIGTLLLPFLGALHGAASGHGGGGFGWGRPVQTEPRNYTRRFSMATGQVFVALAGPAMNVLLALVVAGVHVVLLSQRALAPSGDVSEALFFAVGLNFTLFFFNLVPVPPLDGGWVLARFVPRGLARTFDDVARFGPFIVLAVAMISPLNRVFLVPAQFCTRHAYQLLLSLVGG